MKNARDQDETHRLWINQLYKEHQDLSWFYRVDLKPVVIQLMDLKSVWGKWDPFFRTITISTRLIENHSWDVVLEILKHEMAHQYVSDKCLALDGSPHGEAFKNACKLMCVASWAIRASVALPEAIPGLRSRIVSSEDRRVIARVEKLLSLAQSANEHEAFLAMQKSREICAKHNLEKILHSESEDSMDSLFLSRQKKKTDPVEAKIFSILNDHFGVRVIHTSIFDSKACERFQAAEILGRRESVLMAEYVYYFLRQQCDGLWASYKALTGIHGSDRRSYQLGVLTGFDEKLSSSRAFEKIPDGDSSPSTINNSALQKIERGYLDEFVRARYPRISKKSWGGGSINRGVFSEGQAEGRRLNVNRPIHNQLGFGGYLK